MKGEDETPEVRHDIGNGNGTGDDHRTQGIDDRDRRERSGAGDENGGPRRATKHEGEGERDQG